MTHVARPLRGLPPVLAALAAVIATALPAAATDLPVSAQTVNRTTQWWLAALHAPAAVRAAPAAGKGVTVAVLSTGVDRSHPDLAGSVTAGPDLAATGRKRGSPYWGQEGTAVAGLIAGHGHGHGGTKGITGVAPAARILSIQVTLEYDDPLTADATVARRLPAAIAAGIRYAVGHGASIIALPLDPGTLGSASAGDPAAAGGSAAERAAVRYALAHDVLLIAPAGDNGAGTDSVNYPAAYPGVVAVGATARDGRLAPFTNMRSYVALTAPGSGETPGTTASPVTGLTVTAPGGGYQSLASTDMSAALTAGVAALIRSRYPRLDVAAVTRALERGVTAPHGGARRTAAAGWGHGELDAAAAVAAAAAIFAALPAPTPTPSATPSAAPTRAAPVATSRAIPRPADPGRLLRSLVVGLAVGAGVLIACLIGAIIVTQGPAPQALRPVLRHRRGGTGRPGAGSCPPCPRAARPARRGIAAARRGTATPRRLVGRRSRPQVLPQAAGTAGAAMAARTAAARARAASRVAVPACAAVPACTAVPACAARGQRCRSLPGRNPPRNSPSHRRKTRHCQGPDRAPARCLCGIPARRPASSPRSRRIRGSD